MDNRHERNERNERPERGSSGGSGSSSKVRGYCIVTPRQVYEAGDTVEGHVLLTLSAPLDIRGKPLSSLSA